MGGILRTQKKVLTLGHKALRASCNSSSSVHSYEECLARAKRWCVWHSVWVYDERPLTRSVGLLDFTRFVVGEQRTRHTL